MYNIHLLPASFGDSILIEYGTEKEKHYILIDGGPYYAFNDIMEAIRRIAPEMKVLDLLIATHIDIDHIDGVIRLLNQESPPFEIKEVWFNGYKQLRETEHSDTLGELQSEYLSLLIKEKQLPHNLFFGGGAVAVNDYQTLPVISLPGGMELCLLSPGREALEKLAAAWTSEIIDIENEAALKARLSKDWRYDDYLLGDKFDIPDLQNAQPDGDKSVANCSSIAFIGRYEGKSCLFAGDATSESLLKAINPMLEKADLDALKLDAWKLAHHGSRKSTLEILMRKISCKKALFSSDGKRYHHPEPETLAKLLKYNQELEFYFNYHSEYNRKWDDDQLKEQYHYRTYYPAVKNINGITISL